MTAGGIVICVLVACLATVRAEANIGCLFSEGVCEPGLEWCFDDYAFGRCLPLEEEASDRYELDAEQLGMLEEEMRRLFSLGYEWSHPLTQCVLQQLLAAVTSPEAYVAESCVHLHDRPDRPFPMLAAPAAPPHWDPAAAPAPPHWDPAAEAEADPRDVAFVRFEPSSGDPHPEFADEVYFPPITDDDLDAEMSTAHYVTAMEKRSRRAHLQNTYLPPSGIFTPLYNTPAKFRGGLESRDLAANEPEFAPPDHQQMQAALAQAALAQAAQDQQMEAAMAGQFGRDSYRGTSERDLVLGLDKYPDLEQQILAELDGNPALERELVRELDADPELERQLMMELENNPEERLALEALEKHRSQRLESDIEERLAMDALSRQQQLGSGRPGFSREYNTPDSFRAGSEVRDWDGDDDREEAMSLDKILDRHSNEIPPLDTGKIALSPSAPEDKSPPKLSPKLERLANLLYAEGEPPKTAAAYTEGGLVFLPDQPQQGDVNEGLNALLGSFKRPERLDVKKPGPLFTAINLAEQHHLQDQQGESLVTIQTPDDGRPAEKSQPIPQYKLQGGGKKGREGLRPTPDAGQYDVVDTTFAYIGFKQSITSWHEGRNIVRLVAELLELPPGTLSHTRVDRNEVTFKVEPNKLKMNSSEVARKIEGIKEDLKRMTGVEVTSAGIGDKTKLPTVLSMAADSSNDMWMATMLVAGGGGAVAIAGTALFFLRRTAKSRAKLQGLAGRDTEAVGDYQDLCRARMAGKSEKPEPIGHRIASLSRESEASANSPSSRSSTSSWSEEPALTNMDISTGHMVLSYMEDHLKNKDRLQQEWEALCAYEAEPCATVHARKTDNAAKNRYADVVPYDHSRVVLNDLANASGADYINASTITDHDPRSPAYIATQGPLPHTTAHFWQLVWEQGSVVIVMLTRLTETGAAMCHRYWPEEGSELYHIYEVHLVSEHIWCDDYLVRSFYLKNLKTGETRTVTQFHFLSWCDEGTPAAAKPLLEFRRKVNKSYRGRSCPIVVHCSDGVGRTGTYILIDTVLNRMAKGAKEIDIAATLEHIRDQRANMVRTRQQFEFALTSVAEEVNAILKALPPAQNQPAITAQPKE